MSNNVRCGPPTNAGNVNLSGPGMGLHVPCPGIAECILRARSFPDRIGSVLCRRGRRRPGTARHKSLGLRWTDIEKDTLFISVVAYGAYIPLSRPIQFCLLPYQNFEKKMPKMLQILRNH